MRTGQIPLAPSKKSELHQVLKAEVEGNTEKRLAHLLRVERLKRFLSLLQIDFFAPWRLRRWREQIGQMDVEIDGSTRREVGHLLNPSHESPQF